MFCREDSTKTEIALGERKTYEEFKVRGEMTCNLLCLTAVLFLFFFSRSFQKAVMAIGYMDGRSTFTGEALETVQTNFKRENYI